MNEEIGASRETQSLANGSLVAEAVAQQLEAMLSAGNYDGVKLLLTPVQPVDIAQAIGTLPMILQALAFRLLNKNEAIEVYEYLDPSVQQNLLDRLRSNEVLDLVEEMSPDDRVRLFDELPAKAHVWKNRNQLSDLAGDTWNGTASLKIDNADENLRLLNLNFINNETFFNFSCYESGQ